MSKETISPVNLVAAIQEHSLSGPGSRLRQAREALRMTTHDVASHLHLTNKLIESIEIDEYNLTTNRVFIRGYLRSYAKLVNLPADEILSSFDSLGLVDTPITPIGTTVLLKRNKPALESFAPWIISIFMLGTFLLLFFWWYAQHGSQELNNLSEITKIIGKKADTTSVKSSAVEQIPANINASPAMTTNQPSQQPKMDYAPNTSPAMSSPGSNIQKSTIIPGQTPANMSNGTPGKDPQTMNTTPLNAHPHSEVNNPPGSSSANNPAIFPLNSGNQSYNGQISNGASANPQSNIDVVNGTSATSPVNQDGNVSYKKKAKHKNSEIIPPFGG